MTDESAFVRAILADPGDPALRQVYADWLEERGDLESLLRAEYLRVECELDRLPREDRQRNRLQARLRKLRGAVGDDWWRQLDWARVEYCVEFAFQCPQRWDTLEPTDDPAVRHCEACGDDVHYVYSSREAARLADEGRCVAIDSRQMRLPLGLERVRGPRSVRMGRVAPRVTRRVPLGERGRQGQA
jgi:uncharacterized protein (TIGR02996 family)